ncbi:MAG: T9SS type A sorting domain-containing protein [Chryseosolibacter sp.]
MNKLLLSLALSVFSIVSYAQTCTLTGTGSVNWPTNGTGISCSEGGNPVGKTTLVIPAGLTVNFGNGDTWTGTRMEVSGTLNITFDVLINSSILVKNGGLLDIGKKLSLGTTGGGCAYTLTVATGGRVTVEDTGSDRLAICGVDIMKGAGACNSCGGTNSGQCPYNGNPYCEPAGGFTGPTGFDDDGFNPSLPVELLYFTVTPGEETIRLSWATSMEENFYKFVIQRSADGLSFEDIGEVNGQGFDIDDIVSKYAFEDEAPLLGYNYYRLKAVDLDDASEYFGVRAIRIDGSKKLAVYPNPSTGEMISFRTNFAAGESDRIVLTDRMGTEVFNVHAHTVENHITFGNRLQPGIYMLRYIADGFEQVSRVVIRN